MSSKLLAYLCQGNRRWCSATAFRGTRIQINYSHQKCVRGIAIRSNIQTCDNATYSVLKRNPNIKFYSTPVTSKSPRQVSVESLLENLASHYKQYGYLVCEQFVKLMDQLEEHPGSSNGLITKEKSLFLLEACGTTMPAQTPRERLELFERLWTYLQGNAQLSKEHYQVRLEILEYNRMSLLSLPEFLEGLSKCGIDLQSSPDYFDGMLKAACACGDMHLVTEIVTMMRDKNLALCEKHFNALILGHGRNHDLASCQSILDSMLAAGVATSNETQVMLFLAFLENNERSKAIEIIKQLNRQFSEDQIMQMLRGAALCSALDTELVNLLVKEFPKDFMAGPEVPHVLRNICCEMLHLGQIYAVVDIIKALPTPELGPNQDIDQFGVFLLSELFRVANLEKSVAIEVAQLLKSSGKNTRALHIATEIAMRKSPPAALPFLEALMQEEPLRPHYFWPLIMHSFRRNGESGVISALTEMSRMKVECDQATLATYVLPHLPIALENPLRAVKMLEESGIRPSLMLTPVIRHLLAQKMFEGAREIAENYPTKLHVVGGLIPVLSRLSIQIRVSKRYHRYAKLLLALSNRSADPKVDVIGCLFIEMLTTQPGLKSDLSVVQRFLHEMEKIGLKMSSNAINTVQKILDGDGLKRDGDESSEVARERIKQTLQKMCDRSIFLPQDAATGDTGLNQNSSTFHPNSTYSSLSKHPRDMNLNELECHLIELESKGMKTRGILRRLLQVCVRDNHLDRALEIKAKCDELKVQESPGMIASIFDLYIKKKDLPKAERTLKKLQRDYPGFHVDEHKMIDYAALHVHTGDLETAKQILKDRASKHKIIGGDYVLKNVWNFLTNVAQLAAKTPNLSKETNLTFNMFTFLQQLRYCHAHNTVLGPIVREYLLRGDITRAVAQFRDLAEKCKHTPLQFELLSLLVKLSNSQKDAVEQYKISSEEAQKLLSEVTATVSKVHGVINMHSALVLAFAESGTDNQLRRLLMNPEFHINHELLQKNMEHLGQEGAVATLLRLARGARGLSRAVNEQLIYNMLLNNFVKTNDYEAGLDLYERLEADDDLKISQEFLRNLVSLLKMNNIDVPSNIALRAQVI